MKHIVQYFEKGKELAMSSFVQSIDKEVLRELVLSAVLDATEYEDMKTKRLPTITSGHLEKNLLLMKSKNYREMARLKNWR